MAAVLRIPTVLRPAVNGQTTIEVEGATIGEVLASVTATYPATAGQLLDENGALHRFLNIYVNDDDVRYIGGLNAPVADGDDITLLPGPEILRDVPEITHFVAGLGTSGTLMGVGRYLKEHKPDVQIWAIEPPSGEMVDGLRNLDDGYIPPIFTDNHGAELLDRKVVVRPKESIEWTRRLTEVGLFTGISSGAIMSGAVKAANTVPDDQEATIVTIVCDDGWKYLSTGAWSDNVDDVVERAKKIIYF